MTPQETEHPPLDRLNDTERDLLGLLGRGHTAKSIATLKGLSVAAVNERFRNARRKTGLASSREIARLVVAQENRDDFIGLAPTAAPPSILHRPDAPHPRRASPLRRWRLPMIATALVAAALLAQQTSTPPAVWQDGLGAEILSRHTVQPHLTALNSQVSGGARDPDWSPQAEAALTGRYNGVPNFSRDIRTSSIRCAADVCEVAGILRADATGDDLFEMMMQLQTLGKTEPVAGLDQMIHYFSTSGDTPPAFISYWHRTD